MTYRELGAALGYSDGEVRILWDELRKRGLLQSGPTQEQAAVSAPASSKPAPRAEDIDLTEAMRAWYQEGFNSEDKLMRRFPGLTKYQAGKLRDRILAPGK